MSHVIVLAGPPGCGKTHYRNEHLADVPGLDIADYYARHRERFPDWPVDWYSIHSHMHRDLCILMRQHPVVWVEGLFAAGSPSLAVLIRVITVEGGDYEVRRIDDVPLNVCIERVKEDYNCGRVDAVSTRARIDLLCALIEKRNGECSASF